MTRAARGTGTIEWHRDRWRIRFRLPNGKRESIAGDPCRRDDPEARKAIETIRAAMLEELAGTTDDPRLSTGTLGAYAATWLDEREKTHRDAQGDRQRWSAYVAPTEIARTRLDALTAKALRAFGRELVARPSRRGGTIDRQTARNVWTTLRGILKGAAEAERMSQGRCAELLTVDLPASPKAEEGGELDERIAYTSETQHASVLALELTPDQRSAYLVGRFAGLRAGELHGADWSRVLWDERCLVVARSRKRAPKNGKVGRVPLLAPAFDALRARWEEKGRPRAGLIWPDRDGAMRKRGDDFGWGDHGNDRFVTLGIRWRAGIPRGITFQDATRHSAGVHLLRGTWAPSIVPTKYRLEEVSRFLRHSSIVVTERHYASLALDSLPVTPPAALVPEAPRGSIGRVAAIYSEPVSVGDFESRPRDLNSGPTVYEDGGEASDPGPLAAVAGLEDGARETLIAIGDRDPRAAARAVDVLSRLLDVIGDIRSASESTVRRGRAV